MNCFCKLFQTKKKSKRDVGDVGDDVYLKTLFRNFDLNGDGFIQKEELRSVMQKMNPSSTEEDLNEMFLSADKNSDGAIDFTEFLGIVRAYLLPPSSRDLFDEIDVNGDGYISLSELQAAYQRSGHSLSDQGMKAIFKKFDKNNDGRINYYEFCKIIDRKKH
ncbi:unnamed protein product [Caenorhabditis angaria]|uniref:EF-hand domain-containing protein n=1 Tax=Caenorhabditis angaria TaxID=860376 RepID=A0A9P1J0Q1_9PELO|nr:unnamed protein product [Caenorhabditis angaria]